MTKIINGLEFEISLPYSEGYIINVAEAKALNQTRAENIGNNTRAKIKEMQEANTPVEEIREYVAGIDANYVLTLAAVGSSRKLDPVEREAQKLAKELLKAHLMQTGRKLTVAPEGKTDEEWELEVQEEVDRIAAIEDILKAAKSNVDAKRKQSEKLAAAIGLGSE